MQRSRVVGLVAILLVLFGLAVSFSQREEGKIMAEDEEVGHVTVGGIHDAPEGKENDLHIQELARFAVQEHNKKANALLEFEKLVKVRQQVVAGLMYYFTIEVKEGGVKKLYEARVWEKVWENFKELEDFKPVGDGTSA